MGEIGQKVRARRGARRALLVLRARSELLKHKYDLRKEIIEA